VQHNVAKEGVRMESARLVNDIGFSCNSFAERWRRLWCAIKSM